jgi:serine/threonine protein phosphatase 1
MLIQFWRGSGADLMIALRSATSRKKPRVPAGVRIYAIGDIHGRVDLLDAVIKRIDTDLEQNPASVAIEVYLGDYIDRGPASQQVIDRLVIRNRTFRAIFLKGNHESYLTGFATNPVILDEWQNFGGLETLRSYGIAPLKNPAGEERAKLTEAFRQALPVSHRRFFENLRLSFTCGDFFFVHAGIRPGVPLTKQREEDLLWIRQDFLLCEEEFGKIIVHGHTPMLEPDIRPNRINIDTGAYATGRLTCLRLEDDRIDFI